MLDVTRMNLLTLVFKQPSYTAVWPSREPTRIQSATCSRAHCGLQVQLSTNIRTQLGQQWFAALCYIPLQMGYASQGAGVRSLTPDKHAANTAIRRILGQTSGIRISEQGPGMQISNTCGRTRRPVHHKPGRSTRLTAPRPVATVEWLPDMIGIVFGRPRPMIPDCKYEIGVFCVDIGFDLAIGCL